MSKLSMQDWIHQLESKNELIRVKTKVSPNQEIAEIADRMMKQTSGGQALLFENTGMEFPVLINAYGSVSRIQSVFDGLAPSEVFPQIFNILEEIQTQTSNLKKLSVLWRERKLAGIFPKKTNRKAACQECRMGKPDLSKLPVLQSWPHDPNPFVTLPMVFTKHPETNIRNIGMYRMQVMDKQSTGMHWHRHKGGASHYKAWKAKGEKMPVAVVLGGDPLYTYMATAPLPENIDELLVCGLIRRKPVHLVKCLTQDIEVPADADIVIEGYIDTDEPLVKEGPFGDHTGFYSLEDNYPKFHVTAITHRKNAVYPATIVGIPPMEDLYLGFATEQLFKPAIKLAVAPELLDFHLPSEGVAHNLVLLKVKDAYPGVVLKTMYAMLGAGQMMFSKFLLALPEGMDLTDYKLVLKHVASNINAEAFTISSGPADELEHASPQLVFGGKCLLDLSKVQNSDNKELVFERSDDEILYGNIIVRASSNLPSNENLPESCNVLIHVDYADLLKDVKMLLWWILANTDPKRDIRRNNRVILWDARHIAENKQKQRAWPNPVVSSDEIIALVDKRWNEYGLGNFLESPSKKSKRFVKGNSYRVKID